MTRALVPGWLKLALAAVAIVAAACLIWFAETSFLSGASSLSVVRQWGFIAFAVGLLAAAGFVGYLWWREPMEDEASNAKREDT